MKKFLILLLPILLLNISCVKEQVNENLSETEQQEIYINEYIESIKHLQTKPAPVRNTDEGKMKWIFPNDEIAASYPTNIEEGEIILANKSVVKWMLQYNKTEKKPFIFGMIVEGNIPQNIANATTKGTPMDFFLGVAGCLGEDNLRSCIKELLTTAISDCEKHNNCEHCWWYPNC